MLLMDAEEELILESNEDALPVYQDEQTNGPDQFLDDLICVCSATYDAYLAGRANLTSMVLDTGATSSVCSVQLIRQYSPHILPQLKPTGKSFRFGDSSKFGSLGRIFVKNKISIQETSTMHNGMGKTTEILISLTFIAEVVGAHIPFLLSREALARMNGQLSFATTTLTIKDVGTLQLTGNVDGRLILPFDLHTAK